MSSAIRGRRVVALATGLLLAGIPACRAISRLDVSREVVAVSSPDLFGALAARFGPAARSPKLAAVRPRLVSGALLPSRIYDDSALWSSRHDSTRLLAIAGTPAAQGYILSWEPSVAVPDEAGEARHRMELTRLAAREYRWRTIDELAVGDARAADLSDAVAALLAETHGLSAPQLRTLARLALPRASTAFGTLFSIDSLHTATHDDGTVSLAISARLDPRRLQGRRPHFARYLEKYVRPLRYRVAVTDDTGLPWLELRRARDVMTMRLRLRDGVPTALTGPARALPDTLRIHVEAYARIMRFEVGVSDLNGDLALIRDAHARGLTVRFHREPRWHLPLASQRLLGGPLRRPFEGAGATATLAMRDAAEGQSLAVREIDVSVRETGVLAFLNGLGGRVVTDAGGAVEAERDAWLRDLLLALRGDLAELGSGVVAAAP